VYPDIVARQRIVYASALSLGKRAATASLTTVELSPEGLSSRLLPTESGASLDGMEQPSCQQGTGTWLDAPGAELHTRDPRSDAPADR
jgi:hypothetical protein